MILVAKTLVFGRISVLMSLCLLQIPHRLALTLLGHKRFVSNTFQTHHSPNLMPYSFRYPQCNKISSGVLLGSVLGPLLFLVYVNVTWRNIDSSIRFFADDCIMCRKIIKKNIVRLWKELERGVGGRK